jgi:hypothetical protein
VIPFRSDLGENQWAAIIAFLLGLVAMVIATRFGEPKTDEELEGLVYGRETLAAAAPTRRHTASPRSSRARSRSARCPCSCASSRTPTSSS